MNAHAFRLGFAAGIGFMLGGWTITLAAIVYDLNKRYSEAA